LLIAVLVDDFDGTAVQLLDKCFPNWRQNTPWVLCAILRGVTRNQSNIVVLYYCFYGGKYWG